jgi:hypothetical protein
MFDSLEIIITENANNGVKSCAEPPNTDNIYWKNVITRFILAFTLRQKGDVNAEQCDKPARLNNTASN